MSNFDCIPAFEIIHVVVNYGMGSKILHRAKEHGIRGGTIFLGRGTVNNSLLKFLSLYDESKEIVLMGADKHTATQALVELNKEFHFERPHHGIVFTIGANEIVGSRCYKNEANGEERGANKSMYNAVYTIVNRGMAEDVIEAAQAAGAKGGTIINARGSGVNETSKFFNMDIEPEKEVVIILSKEEITENIVASIREKLEMDHSGNGIIFVQNVNMTYGIYE